MKLHHLEITRGNNVNVFSAQHLNILKFENTPDGMRHYFVTSVQFITTVFHLIHQVYL